MKQLIDLFNKKYGKQYGVIDDSFSNEDIYKIYKIIKTLCSDDTEIMELLDKVKLPSPKTAKESIEKINAEHMSEGGLDDLIIPHYNETLIFEISGEDYGSFYNNSYFNMDTLNLDETKSYVGKDVNSDEEHTYKFVYDKEADALMDENNLIYIYNHKSFNGADFIEDENSAVLTFNMKPMDISEVNGYFRLYEIDKVELDNNCLSSDLTIKNSLTVGNRIGDIGEYSVSEGYQNTASGYCSHSEGDSTEASGYASHAEGQYSTASGSNSHAEGWDTVASGDISHAEGGKTTAIGDYSHAEGSSSNLASNKIINLSSSTSYEDILTVWNLNKFSLAKGGGSHVEGMDNLALGNNSHTEGMDNLALGDNSHAEGDGTTASDDASHAEGTLTIASGYISHAEGSETTASGVASHAEGDSTTASGVASHAEGDSTTASGNFSHAEGESTTASGYYSHAEGYSTTTSGNSSHVEGYSSNEVTNVIQDLSSSTSIDSIITAWNNKKFSLAKGDSSHAEGKDCLALGTSSHAEGNNTSAGNSYCHSEGDSTKATGNTSHAEGYKTEASGNCSHSEGFKTNSIGRNSHAEGDTTTANGSGSHAEGNNTVSNGDNSHAEGLGTKAQGHQQHVQGKYNIVDTSYAHIVGNGTSDTARSNAHTLDWNGNAWYSGKLSQEGTPTEDKDLATKKYVDDKIASIDTTINNTLPSNGLLTLTTDKIQTTTLAVPTDITLPTVTGYTEIHLFFEGSEGVTITTGTTTVRWKTSPTISTGNLYEIVFTYINDTIGWLANYIVYS